MIFVYMWVKCASKTSLRYLQLYYNTIHICQTFYNKNNRREKKLAEVCIKKLPSTNSSPIETSQKFSKQLTSHLSLSCVQYVIILYKPINNWIFSIAIIITITNND